MIEEIKRIKAILDSILGHPKQDCDDTYQLEYPCPRCVEKYGDKEIAKYNCSVSLKLQRFQCWKCADEGESSMKGSIAKLIKMYGTPKHLDDYKREIQSMRDSRLYCLDGFNIYDKSITDEEIELPSSYTPIHEGVRVPPIVSSYLKGRGIDMEIIKEFNIGYSTFDKNDKRASFRIYIPSHDERGFMNYWTGRTYMEKKSVQKYYNPKAERKTIIFNEDKIQWNADITLVEGPFDHIVVPNSIPLLGKALNKEFKLYWDLLTKANANINIFLDGDAPETALSLYKTLNHGRLYNHIRFVPVKKELDPSAIYEHGGRKGIIEHLRMAYKVNEAYLL